MSKVDQEWVRAEEGFDSARAIIAKHDQSCIIQDGTLS